MTGQAYRPRRLDQVGVVRRAVRIVTAETGHSAAVHHTLHEVVPLHPVLTGAAVRKVQRILNARRALIELPEISEAQTHPKPDRPVKLAAANLCMGMAFGVTLHAGV